MELSEKQLHRMAGLLMLRKLDSMDGKDLKKDRFVDKLVGACKNVPYEFGSDLEFNSVEYVDYLLRAHMGMQGQEGDMRLSEFDRLSYKALIVLRYADGDANSLSVHQKRRLYAEPVQGYSVDDIYAFFCAATLQLLEFMAPKA